MFNHLIVGVIEEIIIFLLRIVLDVFIVITGEIVVFIFTIGKHKPRFDLYTKSKPWKFVLFSEMSGIVGLVFWIVVLLFFVKIY
ncbi:MAG: hypothetical protein FWG62_07985 [Proteobacteria bacterium]|nr:hypothetical protein [Pseudomonadota bacterium]